MALPLSRPSLRRQDFDQVLEALVHDRLAGGETNRALAKVISSDWQLKDVALLGSVSDAVRRILMGLGCTAGDRIILSPLAPAYWVEGLVRLGAIPVFADVGEHSPVLDLDAVRALVPGAKAVVADCCLGFLPDVSALLSLGLPVVEDVSHGLGGAFEGHRVGTLGTAVLAHFAPETLVAGAGGALAGFRQPMDLPVASWEALSDLGAALVLSQWKDAPTFAERKREHFRRLFVKLRSHPQPKQMGDAEPVFPWFPILVESGAKDVVAWARKHAVEADWAFRHQPHLNLESASDFCPRARTFLFRTLVFPLYATISERDLTDLGKVISSLP